MTVERGRRVSMVYGLAREAGLEAGEHPAPERLFEYQEGLLTKEQEAEVQDHLTLCPECTRMVLELSGTVAPELPEVEAPFSRERVEAIWPGLRRRLPHPPKPQVARWRRSAQRVALPLAASFLLATLALVLSLVGVYGLVSADGKFLWLSDELQRSTRGNFTLQLARPVPDSGRYRVRLFGVDGGRREPLAEYEVDLSGVP